jgi:hypothetical protein
MLSVVYDLVYEFCITAAVIDAYSTICMNELPAARIDAYSMICMNDEH